MNTTISVVIPTYNRAHTLRRALLSVMAQTHRADEVIVVDDCSSDDTEAVVAQFEGVKYLKMPRNSGAAAARNYGVEQAIGSWIAFLDSDDIWVAHRLERQLECVNEFPDAGLVCTGVTVQECDGKSAFHGFAYSRPASGWTLAQFQTYPFSTPTWLVSKQALLGVGGFDVELPNCEDLDLLAKLVAVTKIYMLPDPLLIKFNQTDSIDSDLERLELSYEVLFERHRGLWEKAPAAAARTCLRLAKFRIANGQMGLGRKALLRAIVWQPQRLRLWAALLASLAGQRFYMAVRG